MVSTFAVPQLGQVIVDSKIIASTHANMKPSTTKTTPNDRTPVTAAMITELPHAAPGAHAVMR